MPLIYTIDALDDSECPASAEDADALSVYRGDCSRVQNFLVSIFRLDKGIISPFSNLPASSLSSTDIHTFVKLQLVGIDFEYIDNVAKASQTLFQCAGS